jgi:hypothetical protein
LTLSVSRKALAFHNCWSLRARYSSWRLQRESRQGRWPIWSDSGIDLVEIAVRRAVGEEITEEQRTPKFNQPLAVRFMTASPGPLPVGRIRSIGALDAVRSSPGVVKADIYMKVGETINPVQLDADRRGFVIATADDSSTALDLADRAAATLEVEADALRNRSPAAA